MGTFREESDDKDKHCGVGTIAHGGRNNCWLIVMMNTQYNELQALDLNTMQLVPDSRIKVKDPKWLSRSEFDKMFQWNQWTTSDYSWQKFVPLDVIKGC